MVSTGTGPELDGMKDSLRVLGVLLALPAALSLVKTTPRQLAAPRSYRPRMQQSDFDVNEASRGIRRELFAKDDAIREMIARAEQRGSKVQVGLLDSTTSFSDFISTARDQAAFLFRVTPPWIDTAFGAILFTLLGAAAKEATFLAFNSPEADAVAARVVTVLAFALFQQLAGLPLGLWLRAGSDPARRSTNPVFNSGDPLAGITFAFIFAVPVALLAQFAGVVWLPPPAPFPDALGTLLRVGVAPATEEIFFRAWLLTAFERAGGSPFAAMIASAGLYGLYMVPLSSVLQDGSLALLLYECLGVRRCSRVEPSRPARVAAGCALCAAWVIEDGVVLAILCAQAYLAFIYQQSGGSLPFAIVTHATFNLLVMALRAARMDSVLPFL